MAQPQPPKPQKAATSAPTATAEPPAEGTGPQIVQTTEVGPPDAPSQKVVVKADLTQEYVSAAPWGWWSDRYVRSLPNPTDRFLRDFGSRLYEEDMPLDAQVYSTMAILVMAVLAEGVHLAPGVDKDEVDPAKQEQAATYQTFCQYNLDHLNRPLRATLYEIVHGMFAVGHKVGELVCKPELTPLSGKELIVLKDIKPKPFRNVAFVTDASYNTVGILYIKPGQSIITGILLPTDVKNIKDILPRDKFCVATNNGVNGDPRGRSHMASVYTPWWKKQGLHPEHMAYIARFGQPSVIYELPPDAQSVPVYDSGGNVIGEITAQEAGNTAMAGVRSGAVYTHAKDGKVYLLEAQGDGAAIFSSFDHEDKQIAKGLLFQTLATEEAEHMARAASSTHQDIFGIFISYIRGIIEAMLYQDVLTLLVKVNYGEQAVPYTPKVSLGDTETQDWPAVATAIAAGERSGYWHWSQYPVLDNLLNAPRDMEQFKADMEQEQAQAQALADAAMQDKQNGGENDGQDKAPAGGGKPAPRKPASKKPAGGGSKRPG
jgi:hypothetical protein